MALGLGDGWVPIRSPSRVPLSDVAKMPLESSDTMSLFPAAMALFPTDVWAPILPFFCVALSVPKMPLESWVTTLLLPTAMALSLADI